MVTIRDIAKRSKVAPGTVSMVLNGRGRMSPETRARVEAIIAETGYRPKSAGRPRRLAAQTPTSIAVVYAQRVACGGVLSQLSQAWIAGIRELAIESRCHLSLIGGFKDGSQDEMFRHAIENGNVDGVILIGITAEDGHAYLTQSVAKGIPTVAMNRVPVHSEFSYVAMDNFGSGKHAVDFLVRRGHRRIAMIHLASSDRYAVDRCAGADAGLAAHELAPACTELIGADPTDDCLKRVVQRVIESGATAAYLTAGDKPAVKFVDTLESMGLRVPQDMSVVGWDDLDMRSQSGLQLTSIGYDKHAMGREAVQVLLQLMQCNSRVCSRGIVVPTYVVEHGTTAAIVMASHL